MIVIFDDKELEYIYWNGVSLSKKYRFQKSVIKSFIKQINLLKSMDSIEDCFYFKSLNYKIHKGKRKGIECIRIDRKYRLDFNSFKSEINNETIIKVLKLSNHYED